MNELFSEATYIQQLNVEDALGVAELPASGSFIDVSKFDHFAFLILAGALDSALTCQVQQATANNGTAKDVTGAVVTVPADGDDKWYPIEVETRQLDINNDYRYVTLDVTGAAGSNDYGAVVFLGFGSEKPPTQSATMGDIVTLAGGQTY